MQDGIHKNVIRILLDIGMIVLFVLLFNTLVTGLLFHEIVGLVVLGVVGAHILINKNWLSNIKQAIKKGLLSSRQKLKLVLNITLAALVAIILVTGILISIYLFPMLSSPNDLVLGLHKWASYVLGGVLVVHTAIHWKFLLHMMKKFFVRNNLRAAKAVMASVGAFALVLVCVYNNVLSIFSQQNYAAAYKATTEDSLKESGLPASAASSMPKLPEQQLVEQQLTEQRVAEQTKEETVQEDTQISAAPSETPEDVITLQQFLGSMFCSACPKHCSLAAPRCSRSEPEIQQATAEYETLYGEA